jgi:hypothetical protein
MIRSLESGIPKSKGDGSNETASIGLWSGAMGLSQV